MDRHDQNKKAQLMLANPSDALTGQSRSPNTVPFDMLGMVCCKTRRF